jgi:hypothetical protein
LVGELRDRDRVLIRMPGPRAVHETRRFVFLVLLEHRECPGIELGILAAREQRRHAADR